MTKPSRPRATARLLALVIAAAALLAACGGSADPVGLFGDVPQSLLDRGAVWRPNAEGSQHLVDLLGLADGTVEASVVTGTPSVTLLRTREAAVARAALDAAGYTSAPGPAEGWTVLVRGPVTEPTVGVPAVGVGPDLIVAGSREEVDAVIARDADPLTHVPEELLEDAVIAFAGTPATAQTRAPATTSSDLPEYATFVMTASTSGSGVIALAVPGAGQADAVALSVRAATTLLEGGLASSTLLQPGEPLAVDDTVFLNVDWLVDPETVLGGRLGPWLAGMLAAS